MPKWNRKFAGEWRIVELPDMSDDYMEEGEGKPYVRLKARADSPMCKAGGTINLSHRERSAGSR